MTKIIIKMIKIVIICKIFQKNQILKKYHIFIADFFAITLIWTIFLAKSNNKLL